MADDLRRVEDRHREERAELKHALIMDACRAVARNRGFSLNVDEVAREAGLGSATVYRHFKEIGDRDEPAKAKIFQALTGELVQRTNDHIVRLMEIEDGRERMMAALDAGFAVMRDYGLMGVEITSGLAPKPYRNPQHFEVVRRFIGRTVKDCMNQGHCRRELDVRDVVDVFFSLIHADRVKRALERGKTIDEIKELTAHVFFSAFATPPQSQ